MAANEKDEINFQALEEQLYDAINADKKYWRENDAKFRAIDQKVATYEEFSELVKASNLVPLKKEDKFKKPKKLWNSFSKITGKEDSTSISKSLQNQKHKKEFDFPKNSQEFDDIWRKNLNTDEERYLFLKKIHRAVPLSDIFQVEIGFGLLGDIVRVLKTFPDNSEDFMFITEVLSALCGIKRFGLALQFLNDSERKDCSELIQLLWNRMPGKQQDLAENGITEITITELANAFDVSIS